MKTFASTKEIIARCKEARVLPTAKSIARNNNVTLEGLLGRDRTATFSEPRKLLYIALRAEGLSYLRIGFLLDRDHTTILNTIKAVGERTQLKRVAFFDRLCKCGASFGDHQIRAPHPIPTRDCNAFTRPA